MTAQEYFDAIPKGRKHPLIRPDVPKIDRHLRILIERARTQGRVIINNGQGYYEVDPQDPIEVEEYVAWKSKQYSRVAKVMDAVRAMDQTIAMKDQESLF